MSEFINQQTGILGSMQQFLLFSVVIMLFVLMLGTMLIFYTQYNMFNTKEFFNNTIINFIGICSLLLFSLLIILIPLSFDLIWCIVFSILLFAIAIPFLIGFIYYKKYNNIDEKKRKFGINLMSPVLYLIISCAVILIFLSLVMR